MDQDTIWLKIFKGLRSDPTKVGVGKIQFDLQRQRAQKRKEGEEAMNAWFEELKEKYAEYLLDTPEVFQLQNAENKQEEKEEAPAPGAEGYFPVIQKETLATGDCFYSSIYRASQEQSLLDKLKQCYPSLQIESEGVFIPSIRNLIANNDKGVFKEIYEYLASVTKERTTYLSILQAQGQWFYRIFSKGLPSTLGEFITQVKQGIQKMTNWAAEVEVTIAKQLLSACGIQIRAYNTTIVEAEKISQGIAILNLLNQGEAHWVYFSFNVPDKFTETTFYKETRQKGCIEECKQYERRIDSAEKAIEGSSKEINELEAKIAKEQARIAANEEILETSQEELEKCRRKCGLLKGGYRKSRKSKKNSGVRRLSLRRRR
jgi:hypothetical protein